MLKKTGVYVIEDPSGKLACVDVRFRTIYYFNHEGKRDQTKSAQEKNPDQSGEFDEPNRPSENEMQTLELIVSNAPMTVAYDSFFYHIFERKKELTDKENRKPLQNAVSNLNTCFNKIFGDALSLIKNKQNAGYYLNKSMKVTAHNSVPFMFLYDGDAGELMKQYKENLLAYRTDDLCMRRLGGGQAVAEGYVQPRLKAGVNTLESILSPTRSRTYRTEDPAAYERLLRCVQAPAGVGKTSLLQSVVVAICDDSAAGLSENMPAYYKDYLPVFIRCSDANTIRSLSSLTELALCGKDFDAAEFEMLLRGADNLLLLVDGIDELYEPKAFMALFVDFLKRYPAVNVIVTSRFDIMQSEGFEQITLSQFTDTDVRTYLQKAADMNPSLESRTQRLSEAIGLSDGQEDSLSSAEDPLSLGKEVLRLLARTPFILDRMVYDRSLELSVPAVLRHMCGEIINRRWDIDRFRDDDNRYLFNADDVRLCLGAVAFDRIFIADTPEEPVSSVQLTELFREAAESGLCSCDSEKQVEALADFARTMSIRTGLLSRDGNDRYTFTELSFERYLAAYYIKTMIEKTTLPAIDSNYDVVAIHRRVDPFSCLWQLLPCDLSLTDEMLFSLTLLVYGLNRKQRKSVMLFLLLRVLITDDETCDRIFTWVGRILGSVFGAVDIADKKEIKRLAERLKKKKEKEEEKGV